MPETVARYFTRDIVNIELTQEDAEPDVQQVDPCYRNKINIMNYSDDCVFKAGDEITFEGVADDLGSPIAAIEFSFDNGRTWTSCDTDGATADSGTPMTAAWPKGDPVAHEHAIIVSWLASSARSRTSMVKFFLMLPPTFT